MPKQKITKEMVVDTAFDIARKDGMDRVLIKKIAGKLGCSVQPIYSYCQNIESLKAEVEARAMQFVWGFIDRSGRSVCEYRKSLCPACQRRAKFVSDFHFAPKAGDQFFGGVLYERDRSGDGGISF